MNELRDTQEYEVILKHMIHGKKIKLDELL